jgi:sodium/proline symporter
MITQYLLAFVCYFLILLVIGVLSHQKQDSNAEFIVGNRTLNFWLTALSAHASDMSAWLFMGLPMAIFINGMSGSWIAIGLLIGMFLTWQFISIRLRVATEQTQTYTLSSYFEARFSDSSGILRVLTAIILVFYLTHYLAAALTAMGLLIESVFGIDYYLGLTFATIVVVSYTFGGGFVTIAWTDLFQAIFLLLVIILIPIMAMLSMDNGFERIRMLEELDPGYLSIFGDMSPGSLLSAIFLALSWGLGYFGMPHIVTKFMGIRDVVALKKSKYLGMTWQLLALSAAIVVGIVGAAFFNGEMDNPELVFVEMVKILCPPFIAGFVLCGILAANLSTMDSQLLVCASAIGEDLFKKMAGKSVSAIQLVRASRVGVVLIAAIALIIAFYKSETIIESVFYAWAGLGSSFGPLVLMSLYSKKANLYGAIAGILVGSAVAGIWPQLNPYIVDYPVPSMVPGFFLNLATIYIVSWATTTQTKVAK